MFAFQVIIASLLQAEISLPAIFTDHMVLQQKTEAAIWGTASKGKTVTVKTSWDRQNYSTRAGSDGKWLLKVRTPAAGGPYTINISDGKAVSLNDILIGEVWLCSGQSNMEMPLKGYRNQPVAGSNEVIALSEDPGIRLFTVKHDKDLSPRDNFEGKWKECTPENVSDFSATAYFFGRMLRKALDVPVGLICSSWGGTRIEPWISGTGIREIDWIPAPSADTNGEFTHQTPTVLYNAMINPMVGYGMRGAIWYQGEANRNQPEKYSSLMQSLVSDWRQTWGIGEFPFYYVEIAPFDYGPSGVNSAFLREAQMKASAVIPNSGMACILDIGEEHCIHPSNKEVTGDRLAYLALANTYGKNGFEWSGPVLKDMKVEGNTVKLTFSHAGNGLTSYGKEIDNFTLAGENRRFFPAKAFITGDGITLFSPSVEKPVAVRYAFDDFVTGELFNTEGLPASSFRTDEWEK